MAAPSKALRLVILSDTHRQSSGPVPQGDVLVHCGDSELSAEEMHRWLSTQPHASKLLVAGNMDSRLVSDREALTRNSSVTYLQDGITKISGLSFYGSPWTPKFVGEFQLDDGQHAERVWLNMTNQLDSVDVLITHGPPAGILDRTSRGLRVGDAALLKQVGKVKPRLHCFGHVHESFGTLRKGETLFCNAALFNGHAPVVVDVPFDRSEAVVVVEGGEV